MSSYTHNTTEINLNEAPPVGGSKWFAHLPIRGGGGEFVEFDAELKLAKIQNSHLCVCVGGGGGCFAEFDAKFKFAKIQNSYFVCVCGGGGGGWWNQFPTFDAESKFAKKKIFFLWKIF